MTTAIGEYGAQGSAVLSETGVPSCTALFERGRGGLDSGRVCLRVMALAPWRSRRATLHKVTGAAGRPTWPNKNKVAEKERQVV